MMAFVVKQMFNSHLKRIITNHRLISTTSRYFLTTSSDLNSKIVPAQDLKLSESCVKRLKEICGDGSFLRVIVEGGGCSGFQYKLEIDDKLQKDDLSFGEDGAKVVVDEVSIEYVAGSTIDFHTELIRAGFRIISNPKAEHGCSCGASFSIKVD